MVFRVTFHVPKGNIVLTHFMARSGADARTKLLGRVASILNLTVKECRQIPWSSKQLTQEGY